MSGVKLTKKVRGVGRARKELVLLAIIDAMGGQTDASDYNWHWLQWFCEDETRHEADTFNRCIDKGWLRPTHDSDTDSSTAYITPTGRLALSQGGGE
jgi:hypothetical protein